MTLKLQQIIKPFFFLTRKRKMEIKIKIVSTEIIKPSSPTPHHLRTHELFPPNLNFPNMYFPLTLFYSSAQSENAIEISSQHLKNSLSKTLTYYYPFAGQVRDGVSSTDCNDHGATFIETQVANEMSTVLEKKDNGLLKHLLPFNGNMLEIPTTCHANIIVQVNYFGCGGIAISICFSHLIADGATAANFVKNWAEVARGVDDIKNLIVDYASIYPPYDAMASVRSLYEQNDYSSSNIVTKMFTFDSKKIAALIEKIGSGPYFDRPTRFEAISTLICAAVITTEATERDEFIATQLAVVIPINLRNKLNPPLPPQCIGNLITVAIAKFPFDKKIDCNNLAGKLHESIRKVVDQYKKNMHEGGVIEGRLSKSKMFHISDASKLPFYEADFGWGKPTWVVTLPQSVNVAILIDTCDGVGVEAWIGLAKEDMAKFEKDPQILAHTKLVM